MAANFLETDENLAVKPNTEARARKKPQWTLKIASLSVHISIAEARTRKKPQWTWTLALLLILVPVLLLGLFVHRRVSGLVNIDAMDYAQLGRNLIDGHGLTTYLLRPLALTDGSNPLVQPDLTHGPLYPLLLALAFGIAGVKDSVVIGISGLFYVLTVPALYILGRRLFSPQVGLLAAVVFMTNGSILDYAIAGTPMTFILFLATCLFLALFHAASLARKNSDDPTAGVVKGPFILAGLLSGMLYLTDPLFLWILPFVLVGIALMMPAAHPARRAAAVGFFVLPVALLALPCMLRFNQLTGNPFFGLRGRRLWMDTKTYPGLLAYRLSANDVSGGIGSVNGILLKLFLNGTKAIEDLQHLPASWILLFVLPGLFFGFADPALGKVRTIVLACLLSVFLGSLFFTFNSALLLIAFPGLLVYALHYLMHLAHQAKLSRHSAVVAGGLLGMALLSPMAVILVTTHTPVAVPQVAIARALARDSQPDEVVFADQPWIVAWYAHRPSVWIPVKDNNLAALRKQFVKARWLFLTEEARNLSPEWNQAFNNLMQWDRQFQYAHENGLPLPERFQIVRNQAPITEALEGFAPVAPLGKDVPSAIIASVPVSRVAMQR